IGSAVKGMLSQMDPYTEYYPSDNDYKKGLQGTYAGIGATIHYSFTRKTVVIDEPFEGSPAAKAGLKKGDEIIAVDKEDMTGKTTSEVSSHLRGEAGTTFVLKIKRNGKEMKLKITREQIKSTAVIPYYGLKGDIGYINFSSFINEGCSNEVRRAIIELKEKGAKKFVIDIRDNGGGLITEAVDLANLFVPKGVEIVSTKGRIDRASTSYSTQLEPLDSIVPLVVLVNKHSASASEIFSGSMQDLDRAVIVGQRTFGKGLVQRTIGLPYGANLKFTAAKYYIPSGRCIQAANYNRSDKAKYEKDDIPDSLTTAFKTRNGREVRDGRGIKPDVEITPDTLSNISFYLSEIVDSTDTYYDWVTNYCLTHETIAQPADFELTDDDFNDFKQKVIDNKFKYDRVSSEMLKRLTEAAKAEGYYDDAKEEFAALENKLSHNISKDLDKNKDEIKQLLASDILTYYYFRRGAVEYSLKHDPVFKKAVEILGNEEEYNKILQGK
ncbi:MAG: S41 family peptidase, partial [Prevotellaceae bacterium]|nr:S41 family peptidase [Prevotellaceae bacterium]